MAYRQNSLSSLPDTGPIMEILVNDISKAVSLDMPRHLATAPRRPGTSGMRHRVNLLKLSSSLEQITQPFILASALKHYKNPAPSPHQKPRLLPFNLIAEAHNNHGKLKITFTFPLTLPLALSPPPPRRAPPQLPPPPLPVPIPSTPPKRLRSQPLSTTKKQPLPPTPKTRRLLPSPPTP